MPEITEPLGMRRIKFDWTINFGNLLTILLLVGSLGAAVLNVHVRLHDLELASKEGRDWRQMHDQTMMEFTHAMEKMTLAITEMQTSMLAREKHCKCVPISAILDVRPDTARDAADMRCAETEIFSCKGELPRRRAGD